MTNKIMVAKIGKNVFSLDPNDKIFDSELNTFKIILEGTKSITLAASTNNQTFTQAHGLGWIPVADAFAKRSGVNQVFRPNSYDVELWGPKLGMKGDVRFNYVAADINNIIFNFDNAKGVTVNVSIRYFVLEGVTT